MLWNHERWLPGGVSSMGPSVPGAAPTGGGKRPVLAHDSTVNSTMRALPPARIVFQRHRLTTMTPRKPASNQGTLDSGTNWLREAAKGPATVGACCACCAVLMIFS